MITTRAVRICPPIRPLPSGLPGAVGRDGHRARETNDPAAAMQIDREVVARHPEFAETHFRLARLLEQRGEWDEVRRHYVEVRDRDGMPMRCPEGFRQAYRDVADKHPAVLLVDGPRVLEAASPHDILNDGLFHDGQHPNLRGYVALAQDLLDQLCRRHALGWPAAVEAPRVDAEACARHFARRDPLGVGLPSRMVLLPRGRLYAVRSEVPQREGGRLPPRRRGHRSGTATG